MKPVVTESSKSNHLPQIEDRICFSMRTSSHYTAVRTVSFAERPNEGTVTLCQQLVSRSPAVWAVLWQMKVIQHSKSADSELLSQNLIAQKAQNQYGENFNSQRGDTPCITDAHFLI